MAFTGGGTMRTEEEKAIVQDLFVPLLILCFALFGFCIFTCIKSEIKKETKYYEKYPECITACNPTKCKYIKRRLEKYND